MKLSKLATSFVVGAAFSAAAFGQQAPKPSAAPTVEAAPSVSTSSGWNLGFSYDYFKFQEEWGGFKAIQDYWGPRNPFDNPGKIKGDRQGGTVSLGKDRVTVDVSYLEGDKAILLRNQTLSTTGVVTGTFFDRVKFKDEIIDARLRFNFTPKVYLSVGYYQQETDQDYSYTSSSAPGGTAGTKVAALTGQIGSKYASAGIGLAQELPLGSPQWKLYLKEAVTGLVGSSESRKVTGLTGTGSSASETIWGARGSLSARLSWAVSQHVALGLEGGGEYRFFFNGGDTTGDKSLGFLGRAAINFRF